MNHDASGRAWSAFALASIFFLSFRLMAHKTAVDISLGDDAPANEFHGKILNDFRLFFMF
jgi:hypothetical protein